MYYTWTDPTTDCDYIVLFENNFPDFFTEDSPKYATYLEWLASGNEAGKWE
jgi:hypothetical protein